MLEVVLATQHTTYKAAVEYLNPQNLLLAV